MQQVWKKNQTDETNIILFFVCVCPSQQEFLENELESWKEMFNIVC